MTPALIEAAVRLADTLVRENEALAALDLARAAGLLDEKQRVTAAFSAAQVAVAQGAIAPPVPVPSATDQRAARNLAARLGDLARENRRLLERAVSVQGRLIETIAKAAQPPVSRYGAQGAPRQDARLRPMTLCSRA